MGEGKGGGGGEGRWRHDACRGGERGSGELNGGKGRWGWVGVGGMSLRRRLELGDGGNWHVEGGIAKMVASLVIWFWSFGCMRFACACMRELLRGDWRGWWRMHCDWLMCGTFHLIRPPWRGRGASVAQPWNVTIWIGGSGDEMIENFVLGSVNCISMTKCVNISPTQIANRPIQ